MKSDILPAQVRAARALVDWTRDQLAAASAVTVRTVARFEAGESVITRPTTIDAIRAALEAAGIEFIDQNGGGAGVRLRNRDGAS